MTAGLAYPLGPPPAPGRAVQVGPGVLWLRMPMPYALDHINLWAVDEGEAGWAVIDTGLQTVQTAAAWRELLGPGGPLGMRRISRVLITHMHPDHVGMAGWLTRRFDCALWMTRLEYLTCRVLVADTGREAPPDGVRFYRAAGWTDDDLDSYRARFGSFGKMIHPLPDSFRRLQDGARLRIGAHEWEVVVGYGHSPEHACLYCPALRLLVSGDQVLPRISSNVSVHPTEPDADPMREWLQAIETIRARVPDDALVLPAHNEPFTGLHRRLDELRDGVATGLERLRERLREPRRVIDVFESLFRRAVTGDPQLLNLATGESIAHINYLLHRGEAVVADVRDGVTWYRLKETA